MKREDLLFLPISINIAGKKILLIGGGKAAFHKATILNRFTDQATIIASNFLEDFNDLPFILIQKDYEQTDLNDVFLVYICTGNDDVNIKIKQDCEQRGILASVCDNPIHCDFTSPAIYKSENITISVASNSQNVYQSISIRNQIQELVESKNLAI